MHLITGPITALGRFFLWWLEFLGGLGYLLRDTAVAIKASLFSTRGRRLGWQNLWAQMVRVGVRSIPIISLVVFCIGAILAFQMAPILKDYGALAQVADIIGIAMFRELGPLVAAIVLTGFAGASITAEIGSMVVSEEIEALEAGAIPPIRFLVVPRVLATTVMMVSLAVIADIVGTAGGMFVSRFFLGIGFLQYAERTFSIIKLQDFLTGLLKAGVFGSLISGLACYLGLNVTGGAEGVGNATTKTVVYTIVALITVDLMFTAVFYYLGL
ncbi:MAG: phospholipid/cholesterol/gamma-HCH transport system permease protein [Phycisphaerales bacterium]|jgi:phospholipid/cholesterol/gamma-HCH transport system permease protein|nr:phospholipid/cholesterol/gamma-HCH transport system permease protein [Phycisphaerales bacterium]